MNIDNAHPPEPTESVEPVCMTAFAIKERLIIVGADGGTHIGGALFRAARRLGVCSELVTPSLAYSGLPIANAFAHRLLGKRPIHLRRFEAHFRSKVEEFNPSRILVVGSAPMSARLIGELKTNARKMAFFSSDDPWNMMNGSARLMAMLPLYDFIFSPRRSALPNFEAIGCPSVHYLPFAAEHEMVHQGATPLPEAEQKLALFIGGADKDRIAFFERFVSVCQRVKLGGDYWIKTPSMRHFSIGLLDREQVVSETGAAAVNICLVRRANRDGHVMRSFEIMARGGCMLAEDTPDHRDIFGAEGQRALYFESPEEAAQKANLLLADGRRRTDLRHQMLLLAQSELHSYGQRVKTMLEIMA